jgi:hypothetical protein
MKHCRMVRYGNQSVDRHQAIAQRRQPRMTTYGTVHAAASTRNPDMEYHRPRKLDTKDCLWIFRQFIRQAPFRAGDDSARLTRHSFRKPAVPDTLTIRRPDDWHLHLRDDEMLRAVLPFTANVFGRAIVMPNLTPPVACAADAAAYRDRILAALPAGAGFEPLMTAYLTDGTDAEDLAQGHADGIFTAAKLYPAGATTNSDNGVTDIANIQGVLATMECIGMPLLVHGEVTDPAVDIFDREKVFIDRVLKPALEKFSALKVVFEHITTADGVAFVRSAGANVAAT